MQAVPFTDCVREAPWSHAVHTLNNRTEWPWHPAFSHHRLRDRVIVTLHSPGERVSRCCVCFSTAAASLLLSSPVLQRPQLKVSAIGRYKCICQGRRVAPKQQKVNKHLFGMLPLSVATEEETDSGRQHPPLSWKPFSVVSHKGTTRAAEGNA